MASMTPVATATLSLIPHLSLSRSIYPTLSLTQLTAVACIKLARLAGVRASDKQRLSGSRPPLASPAVLQR